jgi:hypothetical protein
MKDAVQVESGEGVAAGAGMGKEALTHSALQYSVVGLVLPDFLLL